MAGVSVCVTRSRVAAWEPNLRQYRVTYKVVMSDVLDGPESVLSYMATQGYVVRNLTYSVGNDADALATLIKIGAPRRDGGDTSKTTWLVDTEYEFNLDNLPALRPVKIEPYFEPIQEPIESSYYYGAFNRIAETWVEKPLTNATYKTSLTYPIGNSAGVPILPAPERPALNAGYRVSWLKATPVDAASFAGTWNVATFTLESVTKIYNAPEIAPQVAPLFYKTFAPFTLRLANVQQPLRTIYGRDWYEVTLEFIEDDFYLYELDRGLTARVKVGDPDGKGGTISVGDLPEGGPGQRDILDFQGQPVSDPVLLNGEGKPIQEMSATLPAVYLKWDKGDATNFNQLGIGNPN